MTGRDGDLRKYLMQLAEADDVQKFIRENPFGQKPITESSAYWMFYRKIINPPPCAPKKKKQKKQPAPSQERSGNHFWQII